MFKPPTRFLASCLLAALPVRSTPPTSDYELLFADEFEGDRINEQHWSFRTGPRTGPGINGLNLAPNVAVTDGHLVITAKQETINGRLENTGGGLISKHRFGYGYYETRSQPFMGGRGVHAAFWQRGLGEENNSIFEIDSYELDSTYRIASNNLYVDVSPRGFLELAWPHRANVPLTLPADGWFVDAYEYTPEGVVFYDHGRIVAKAECPDLVAAQNVWLTALNGVGTVDANRLPGITRFDYFRYYARDYPGANLLPIGGFEYNQDKTDLQRPVAWTEEGDATASRVVRGGAAHGDFRLRHESDRAYTARTAQTLQFIRNGDYELRARVRRGGSHQVARLRVSDTGALEAMVDVPIAEVWTEVRLARVAVTANRATIAIESQAAAGAWLEVDEVQFLKPPPAGRDVRPTRSFAPAAGDPIWRLAAREAISFTGDDKFYFFGRNVGLGDAITVSFIMRPGAIIPTFPVSRLPATGDAGWAVGLAENGDLFFRLGSHASYGDVVARAAWRQGTAVRVTCVYNRGAVSIHLDGVLRTQATVARYGPHDTTAAGILGANSGQYRAVGDVTLGDDTPPTQLLRYRSYIGTLADVRIFNRALSAAEIAALPNPQPTLTRQPSSHSVAPGSSVVLHAEAIGFPAPTWQWRHNGVPVAGATAASFPLRATAATAGSYSVVVSNADGSTTSAEATVTLSADPNIGHLVNLSVLTELPAAGDTGSFTLGYVVGFPTPGAAKSLLVRAAGPSLAPLGVQGAAANPRLELFAGPTAAAQNDDWGGTGSLTAAGAAVGAFPFSGPTSLDAAALVSVSSTDHSARISASTPGTVLAEVYDATPGDAFTAAMPRLINASVRKHVEAGASLTAGFALAGSTARTVLVRAVGPGLDAFGVAGTMSDPLLTLYDRHGPLAQNDDWDGSVQVDAAMAATGAFTLRPGSSDAVLLRTLAPGTYTAEVKPASAGGVVLVETYEVP